MPLRLIALLILLVCLSACSGMKKNPEAVGADSQTSAPKRELPDNIQIIENLVKREEYKKSLMYGGNINRIRLPEIYQRGAEEQEKQYRFFDVKPGSVYEMLGIQNADILIAVEGYMVPSQVGFFGYISVLHNEQSSNIEVLRNGTPVLLKNTFVP